MSKTAILILAAGSSSRMKKTKQLLPYKNTTLLGWAIKQANNSSASNIFCVLGANKKIIEKSISNYNIETIFNPNFKDGLSSSIVAGIDFISKKNYASVLIMLADQPNVDFKYLNELIKSSEENPTKIISSNYNRNVGVPALFPKKYFKKLLELKGDKGAKLFLQENISDVIKMKALNLIDIDTPEEYYKLTK